MKATVSLISLPRNKFRIKVIDESSGRARGGIVEFYNNLAQVKRALTILGIDLDTIAIMIVICSSEGKALTGGVELPEDQ